MGFIVTTSLYKNGPWEQFKCIHNLAQRKDTEKCWLKYQIGFLIEQDYFHVADVAVALWHRWASTGVATVYQHAQPAAGTLCLHANHKTLLLELHKSSRLHSFTFVCILTHLPLTAS